MQFEFKSQLKEIKIQNLLTKSGKLINRSSNNLNWNWPPRNRKEKRKLFFSRIFSGKQTDYRIICYRFGRAGTKFKLMRVVLLLRLESEWRQFFEDRQWMNYSEFNNFLFFYCFYIKIKTIIIIFILFNFFITWGRWWKKGLI